MATNATNGRKRSIDAVIRSIEKAVGNKDSNVIRRFGDEEYDGDVDVISFGDPDVDAASNCGGIPLGKMVEIFGPESGGKSLLSLKLIASAQSEGRNCCLVDAEQSFDPRWAKRHGVDVDNLFIINDLMSAEKMLDYVAAMCSEPDGFDLIVVDSTAALIPEKELEGSVGDQDYALLARAMSKGCRKIVQGCGSTKTTCVFLNQIREKMGVMFGNPETTPGGRALKFYSHQRISVRPGSKIKEDGTEKIIGRESYIKFEKNKTAAPFGECIFRVIYDATSENPVVKLVTLARNLKLIPVRDGTFKIHKSVTGVEKNIETDCSTLVDVANWVVKNGIATLLVEATIQAVEESTEKVRVDPVIPKMLEDESLIVSPLKDLDESTDDAPKDNE